MKLLVVAPWGQGLGGAEAMLKLLVTRLDPHEIQPSVVLLQPGPLAEELSTAGIVTSVVPAGRLRQVAATTHAVRALARHIREVRPDVVLGWSPKMHLYVAPAAALARFRRPVIWWQHGVPDDNWLDRLATRLPARAVGCSSHASASAQAELSPSRETFVVHPGIEPTVDETARPEIDRKPCIGIVGRLQPWKGQDRFLHALAILRSAGRDVQGLVVGGDAYGLSASYAASLQTLAKELGLGGDVTFTGQVPVVTPFLDRMDVLVNASIDEPFGIVLLEAMAAGVPVVAVDSAGPREIVEHDRSGVLVPSAEPRALADGCARLLDDDELRSRLAAAARRQVAERFTTDVMAATFAARMRKLVSR